MKLTGLKEYFVTPTRQPCRCRGESVPPRAQRCPKLRRVSRHKADCLTQPPAEGGTAAPTVAASLAHADGRAHDGRMTITDNAASLTRLLDEAAVRDATARFAEAATSADYDGFRTLWADDAIWVIGTPKASPSRGAPRGQTTAGDPQTPVSQDDEVSY